MKITNNVNFQDQYRLNDLIQSKIFLDTIPIQCPQFIKIGEVVAPTIYGVGFEERMIRLEFLTKMYFFQEKNEGYRGLLATSPSTFIVPMRSASCLLFYTFILS